MSPGLAFLQPEAAWLLPALLLAAVLWRRYRRRHWIAASGAAWSELAAASPSLLRRAPALLQLGALACAVIALMEPVVPISEAVVESRGVDIALVLDLSSSMQEVMARPRPSRNLAALRFTSSDRMMTMQAAGPTRLETTKQALREFIVRRRDDRIGLIVFSDNAYVVSPLSLDYDYLLHYVDMVDDRILRGEGMTAIGDGLSLANTLLDRQREKERRSQVAVVFTDGEHNYGRDPVAALEESANAGIRVHLIGIDLEDDTKGSTGVGRLVKAVRQHGGRYFEADTEGELRAASQEIDSLEEGSLTSRVYVRDAPAFHWFALAAAGLLALASALGAIPFFSDLT